MQAYFEPEQIFSISMPHPVFEISITYNKKTCNTRFLHFRNMALREKSPNTEFFVLRILVVRERKSIRKTIKS